MEFRKAMAQHWRWLQLLGFDNFPMVVINSVVYPFDSLKLYPPTSANTP